MLKVIPKDEVLVIGHSRRQEEAEKLREYLMNSIDYKKEILIWEIGPTLGVHIGPGALSLLWIGEEISK